jgi:ribosomal protein S18 acetylase RimI-like enzyme
MSKELQTSKGLVRIRSTVIEDAQALRDLRLEALRLFPSAFGTDYAANLERPFEYWQNLAAEGSNNPWGSMYVAEAEDDSLIGMTGTYRYERVKMRHNGYIYAVYVQPAWRGQGIADTLVNACVDWAKEHQLSYVKLSVVTTNTGAIRCYTRCGFEVYGVEPAVLLQDGKYHDELLMYRQL